MFGTAKSRADSFIRRKNMSIPNGVKEKTIENLEFEVSEGDNLEDSLMQELKKVI